MAKRSVNVWRVRDPRPPESRKTPWKALKPSTKRWWRNRLDTRQSALARRKTPLEYLSREEQRRIIPGAYWRRYRPPSKVMLNRALGRAAWAALENVLLEEYPRDSAYSEAERQADIRNRDRWPTGMTKSELFRAVRDGIVSYREELYLRFWFRILATTEASPTVRFWMMIPLLGDIRVTAANVLSPRIRRLMIEDLRVLFRKALDEIAAHYPSNSPPIKDVLAITYISPNAWIRRSPGTGNPKFQTEDLTVRVPRYKRGRLRGRR